MKNRLKKYKESYSKKLEQFEKKYPTLHKIGQNLTISNMSSFVIFYLLTKDIKDDYLNLIITLDTWKIDYSIPIPLYGDLKIDIDPIPSDLANTFKNLRWPLLIVLSMLFRVSFPQKMKNGVTLGCLAGLTYSFIKEKINTPIKFKSPLPSEENNENNEEYEE